ncbi:MAG TPA: hypothetical protein VLK37_12375 [Solirubrobacterales bacterium]|nr:hypothetical protein [Solirubrobacterales bacterium]
MAIGVALFTMLALGSISTAKAGNLVAGFECGKLDPAWTGNYRCDSPDNISGYKRDRVFINTYERAGCVDYADVWHNLINSWVCYPKGTELGSIKVREDGGWYRGAIRNNNLTYAGNFNGLISWWG